MPPWAAPRSALAGNQSRDGCGLGVGARHQSRRPLPRSLPTARWLRATCCSYGPTTSTRKVSPGPQRAPPGRSADGPGCAARGGAICSRRASSATPRRSSYGPDDKDGTKLLAPGQEPINVLGEAFGAVRVLGQTITGYRQLINRPFINPQDNRMVPNTFEGYTLTGAADNVLLHRRLHHEDEDPPSPRASSGCPTPREERRQPQEGVVYAGGTWNFAKNGYVRMDEQYARRRLQHLLRGRQVPDPDRRQDFADAWRAVLPTALGRRGPDRLVLDVWPGATGRGRIPGRSDSSCTTRRPAVASIPRIPSVTVRPTSI